MNPLLLRAIAAAIVWGIWPLVLSKYAKGPWAMSIMMMVSTLWVAISVMMQKQIGATKDVSWLYVALIPIVCGCLNGIGIKQYDAMFQAPHPGTWITITVALLPCVTFILGVILFNDASSLKNWIGVVAVVGGIYLLSSK